MQCITQSSYSPAMTVSHWNRCVCVWFIFSYKSIHLFHFSIPTFIFSFLMFMFTCRFYHLHLIKILILVIVSVYFVIRCNIFFKTAVSKNKIVILKRLLHLEYCFNIQLLIMLLFSLPLLLNFILGHVCSVWQFRSWCWGTSFGMCSVRSMLPSLLCWLKGAVFLLCSCYWAVYFYTVVLHLWSATNTMHISINRQWLYCLKCMSSKNQ